MLDYGINKAKLLERESLIKVKALEEQIDRENVDGALDYFERLNDHAAVKQSYKERAAIGVRKVLGPDGKEEGGWETYTKQRTAEMIENGEVEIVTSGIGTKIVAAQATLTTMPTQSYEYITDSGEKDEDTADVISRFREAGQYDQAVADADYISCAVESGPLMIGYSGDGLRYSPFSPACIYALYHDTITDNGKQRRVDCKDLEDATVVVVEMSSVKGANATADRNFVAFFGRSSDYPLGRQVSYSAREWNKWPDNDSDGDWHEEASGLQANPASLMAHRYGGIYGVEYPIAIFRGGLSLTSGRLAPISTSLYENCMEIDVAFSRLLKDALNAAKGTGVFSNPKGEALPRCLEGIILLQNGQEYTIMDHSAANAVQALDVVNGLSKSIAEGYSVPSYHVTEVATAPESGVALYMRTIPMIQHRERRASINAPQMERIYNIERALIRCHSNDAMSIGENTKQVWSAGRYVLPEDEKTKAERIKVAQDAGYIDYVRAMRDFHDLPTDEDAVKLIEKMNERRIEYPGPKAAAGAKQFGLEPRIK